MPPTSLRILLLQPPPLLPSQLIPDSGPLAWVYRSLYILYTLVFLAPLVLVCLPFSLLLPRRWAPWPPHEDWLPPGSVVPYDPLILHTSPQFSYLKLILRTAIFPIITSLVHSITFHGIPPSQAPCIPKGSQKEWRKKGVEAKLVIIPPLGDEHRSGFLRDERVWGAGRREIPCFWVWRTKGDMYNLDTDPSHQPGQPYARVKHTESGKVILYICGGGYVRGRPLHRPLPWVLASHTGLPVFSPDYTKSLTVEGAFPTPLIDVLAAFQHLLALGYMAADIVLVGDSAGGGLVWTLASWLGIHGVVFGGVVMISPWLDLTLSGTSYTNNRTSDVLNLPHLRNAANQYLARLLPPTDRDGELMSWDGFARLGKRHPLWSPAAEGGEGELEVLLGLGEVEEEVVVVGWKGKEVEVQKQEKEEQEETRMETLIIPTGGPRSPTRRNSTISTSSSATAVSATLPSHSHPTKPTSWIHHTPILIMHGSSELFSSDSTRLSTRLRALVPGLDFVEVRRRGGVHCEDIWGEVTGEGGVGGVVGRWMGERGLMGGGGERGSEETLVGV